MIEVGNKLPHVSFTVVTHEGMKTVSALEYFAGKKAVLFAVPGAFTPTCSEAHLPEYVVRYGDLIDKGVEEVTCIAVNDAFVLKAWAQQHNAEKITMIADGNADFTKALGLDIDTHQFGGVRSRRYVMLLEDAVVTVLNAEESTDYDVSRVDSLLQKM